MLGWVAAATGCIIPPSLETDTRDAGVNSPPAITAIRLDTEQIAEPGPLQAVRGRGALQVEAIDTDDADLLYVRIYVDYSVEEPTPARAQCVADNGMSGDPTRSCTADITGLCQMNDVGSTDTILATIRVFDRKLSDSGVPVFQSMEDPAGLSTAETFKLNCRDPS